MKYGGVKNINAEAFFFHTFNIHLLFITFLMYIRKSYVKIKSLNLEYKRLKK